MLFKFTERDKEIFKVFKKPKLHWYLGKIVYGTPYFDPINFVSSIISIRKLIPRLKEEAEKLEAGREWSKGHYDYTNIPMVRRSKYTIVKLFGNHYFISYGWPIKIGTVSFGWKTKYDTYRFEFPPAFYIFFFKWQLFVHPLPISNNWQDNYWEQILWFVYKCDCDIDKARKTWPWIDGNTRKSTWKDEYLLGYEEIKE